jgi:hypothetical protein
MIDPVPSARDRFVIVTLCVTNLEDEPVSLLPMWRLEIKPGNLMSYDGDVEPPTEWDLRKREVAIPAAPALSVPLHLEARKSIIGYWCFFIDDQLDPSVA